MAVDDLHRLRHAGRQRRPRPQSHRNQRERDHRRQHGGGAQPPCPTRVHFFGAVTVSVPAGPPCAYTDGRYIASPYTGGTTNVPTLLARTL